jgi:tRNA C32,U32 (ribose-2'-O)-methylase TrmJ
MHTRTTIKEKHVRSKQIRLTLMLMTNRLTRAAVQRAELNLLRKCLRQIGLIVGAADAFATKRSALAVGITR